eukprot:Skav202286  [mRNA]  locus=scaffold3364:7289:8245:+ [translate_table: standard]
MVRNFIGWAVLAVATATADVMPEDDECASGECTLHALQSKATMTSACHDAQPGDACYKDIMWAKHTGIKLHPHWYPGLSSASSDEEFQQIVHSHNPGKCAAPCPKRQNKNCHTALPEESCYKDIMWAKNHGIREHPHWYHGLSPSSTNEEFQADIHSKRPDKCPMPCATATEAPVAEPAPVVPETPVIPQEVEPEEPVVPEPQPQPAPETTAAPHHQHHEEHHQHHEEHHEEQHEENNYQNSPCNQLTVQREREECFQAEIRQEQLEREQREREENEAEQHRQENMPLDERQQEIIDEIGGPPTVDGLPDFSDDDPDA